MKRMELVKHNFARLRNTRGWTQPELAEKGGVTPGYIGGIEAGLAKSFSARAEVKWSEIFGVSISEFFLEPGQTVINVEQLKQFITGPNIDERMAKIRDEYPRSVTDEARAKGYSVPNKKEKATKKYRRTA